MSCTRRQLLSIGPLFLLWPKIVLTGADTALPQHGGVDFDSSDARLVGGFAWAKAEALSYVRNDGPIGSWYEAALPGRNAFCMRDVSHMSTGAHMLGLQRENRNMLGQFVRHISASKKWATWWEVTGDGKPAPVDYKSDSDFWYDLPANFDVLDACYRQWQWTGDSAYIGDEAFLNFYRRTVTDYIRVWDRTGSGFPEHPTGNGHMGIGTYDEDLQRQVMVGADLVAAQYAAFRDYAAIERARGDSAIAEQFERKAAALQSLFNTTWWDAARGSSYLAMGEDGRLHNDLKIGTGGGALEFPLYYGITAGDKTRAALDALEQHLGLNAAAQKGIMGGVEGESYLPNIFYKYGRSRSAYSILAALIDPSLKRRTYPEVSFTILGNIATGLMGIRPVTAGRTVETFPQLTRETLWAEIQNVPFGRSTIAVRHRTCTETKLTNQTGPDVLWRASFPGTLRSIHLDGKERQASTETRAGSVRSSWCEVRVPSGQTMTAAAGEAS